jgi:hypothetical protein
MDVWIESHEEQKKLVVKMFTLKANRSKFCDWCHWDKERNRGSFPPKSRAVEKRELEAELR